MEHYTTLIFDCDGVVLNSNKVKTDAFYQVTLPYGEAAASEMVRYHIANGGISRYKKFTYFLDHIAPVFAEREPSTLQELLHEYAFCVQKGLLDCEIAPGLKALRKQTINSRWLIVSGGDQTELRDIFARRGIAEWFDGGIYGSPRNKHEILANEIKNGCIRQPVLFLGDSKYDYHAATSAGLDFVFISAWTEVVDWKEWVTSNQIKHQPLIA